VWPTSLSWSRQRWQGETALAQLKTPRKLDGWHGKTGPGVLNERTILAIVDNVVRVVMWPSATRQLIGVARSSFLDALRWLGALRPRTP
jgi:hypothetical protein